MAIYDKEQHLKNTPAQLCNILIIFAGRQRNVICADD